VRDVGRALRRLLRIRVMETRRGEEGIGGWLGAGGRGGLGALSSPP
jgi:hypothetical protein